MCFGLRGMCVAQTFMLTCVSEVKRVPRGVL